MKAFKLDDNAKTGTGFKVPESYFDTLSQSVMQQLPAPETKVVSLYAKRKSWVFAAAAVLVLSLMIPALNTGKAITDEPDVQALENYLSYHSDITDEQLVDLLETEDIEKIRIDYNMEDKALEDVLSNSNLENYIID